MRTPIALIAAPLVLALAPAVLAQEAPAEEPVEEATEAVAEEPAGPVTYALDPGSSHLYVIIRNDDDRWTPVQGHDHAITAVDFDGTVVWDVTDASACKVSISFPVSSLAVDPPGMRERAGLPADGAIGDGAKNTVVNNMLGKSQLYADQFPRIAYEASDCKGTEGTVPVTGSLTVRGVGEQVTVPMDISIDGDSFHAKGSFTLSHDDFGFKPFTYGPATPRNEEVLEFHVDVRGTATP